MDRIINSAVKSADERFVAVTVQRLTLVPGVCDALMGIIAARGEDVELPRSGSARSSPS